MENKRTDILFGIVVIAFLVVTIILVKDFDAKRANDFKEYTASISNIVQLKNNRIRMLSNQLMLKEKENEDLKNTLSDTRNALEGLSKKLIQPVSMAVPTTSETTSAPTSVTTTAPAGATK